MKWGVSQRRVHVLCGQGRVLGAERHGGIWLIPDTASKPADARRKPGSHSSGIEAGQKLYDRTGAAPDPPPNAIQRARLLSRLAAPGVRLVYIHAGAGHGKTTLLAQYAAGRAGLVWFSAEESDGDVLTFLGHLERCVRRVLPRLDFHAGEYLPYSGRDGLVPAALTAFLRATSGTRLTFVLDDVHFLTRESQRFLIEWAKACPPEHTLIMSSRSGLPVRLLRLKLDGRITEITRADLAFTRDEADAVWEAPCEPAYRVTEGWPLALQSYRMAALGNPDITVAGLGASQELFS